MSKEAFVDFLSSPWCGLPVLLLMIASPWIEDQVRLVAQDLRSLGQPKRILRDACLIWAGAHSLAWVTARAASHAWQLHALAIVGFSTVFLGLTLAAFRVVNDGREKHTACVAFLLFLSGLVYLPPGISRDDWLDSGTILFVMVVVAPMLASIWSPCPRMPEISSDPPDPSAP